MWLAAVVGGLLMITVVLIPLGVALMIAAVLGSIIMGVVAVKTSQGQPYTYPWRISILH